jgi:hypothetical protein
VPGEMVSDGVASRSPVTRMGTACQSAGGGSRTPRPARRHGTVPGPRCRPGQPVLVPQRARLGTVHARTDGRPAFVDACLLRAHRCGNTLAVLAQHPGRRLYALVVPAAARSLSPGSPVRGNRPSSRCPPTDAVSPGLLSGDGWRCAIWSVVWRSRAGHPWEAFTRASRCCSATAG